nr:hypothetical protein [Schwartzia sp. (in: firmicutes)]
MITKWTLQEEIPLPATSPWHEVPEGVHEIVFSGSYNRLSSLPRKAPPGGEQHASDMLLGSRRLTDEVFFRRACISHYIKRSAPFSAQRKKLEANFAFSYSS